LIHCGILLDFLYELHYDAGIYQYHRYFSSVWNTFKSATLTLYNYVTWSNMVIVTCKVCKILSFSLCVFHPLSRNQKKKIGRKLSDYTIETFPFQALLQFLTLWFMVIKNISYNIGLYSYGTPLYKGVSNLSRRQSVSLLIVARKILIWVRNYIIDYIHMRRFLCGMCVKGKVYCIVLVLGMQPHNPTTSIKFTICISPQLIIALHTSCSDVM